MAANNRPWRVLAAAGFLPLLLGGLLEITLGVCDSTASDGLLHWRCRKPCADCASGEGPPVEELGGTWYWLRSPDEEKRIISSHYNRYCIRCHGVDGRGVWDIPDVPDFTNPTWQASRADGQLARLILEGRGAVMPPFRGTLTLEEAWAMARYLRTFVPGTEIEKPAVTQPEKPAVTPPVPTPKKLENLPK